jgi:AcrR family transcriptional regulator
MTQQPEVVTRVQPDVRTRILDSAYELFSQRGIREVGVNELIAHAEVANGTLYRHFKSKGRPRDRLPRAPRTALDARVARDGG